MREASLQYVWADASVCVSRCFSMYKATHTEFSDKPNTCPRILIVNPKSKVFDIRNEVWNLLPHRS